MRRQERLVEASKQARDETNDETPGTRRETRDGADAIGRELIAAEWQLVFLPRRSHKLVNITRRPGLSFRSAPPGSRPRSAPRWVGPFPVLSLRPGSRLVISFAYRFLSSSRVGFVPFTAAETTTAAAP